MRRGRLHPHGEGFPGENCCPGEEGAGCQLSIFGGKTRQIKEKSQFGGKKNLSVLLLHGSNRHNVPGRGGTVPGQGLGWHRGLPRGTSLTFREQERAEPGRKGGHNTKKNLSPERVKQPWGGAAREGMVFGRAEARGCPQFVYSWGWLHELCLR